MTKNTIQEKDGVYFLLKNDKNAVCPYRNPIMVQSQFKPGSMEYMDIPCSSLCPLFILHKRLGEDLITMSLQLNCSNDNQNRIIIDEYRTESKLTSI